MTDPRLHEILAEELNARGINGTPISYFEAATNAMRRAVEEALARRGIEAGVERADAVEKLIKAVRRAHTYVHYTAGAYCDCPQHELARALAALDSTPPATADAGGGDD